MIEASLLKNVAIFFPNNKYFVTFTFLRRKFCILSENIFGKT